jgi:hypothetical protein
MKKPAIGAKIHLSERLARRQAGNQAPNESAKGRNRGGRAQFMALIQATLPLGIVVRRTPGVTRWAKWAWTVSAVLPGAGPASWRELRREGDAVEFHAATLPLTLYSSDTEAYKVALASKVPGVVVVLRDATAPDARMPFEPVIVTASAYEGQDYMDSGDGLIEQVPMPAGLIAWVNGFVEAHHVEVPFIKRKRDRKRIDLVEDGKGDARIRQSSDVFRAPRAPLVGRA